MANFGTEFQKNTSFIDRNSLMNVIEIGCYHGETSNYIVDNLLTNNGNLICIDPLFTDYQLESEPDLFINQYEYFIENTERNNNNIFLYRKKSEQVLPTLRSDFFDMIFVDGHHAYPEATIDIKEGFRLLREGGYLLIDDYLWGNAKPIKQAVDDFLSTTTNYRLLLKLNQVLVQKLPEGSKTENGQSGYQARSTEVLFSWDNIHAAYCNLNHREDRNEKMIKELERVGISQFVHRNRSFPWEELYNNFSEEEKEKVNVMYKRTPGAIGCYYSQMEVMKQALVQNKHAFVMEDDLAFCDDFPARLKIIYKFLNQHEWDIFWFGGTYHIEPTWHKSVEGKHTHPDMQLCNCILNRDWEETHDLSIRRTYGAFSTHAYFVNKDRIEHILMLLERAMPMAMGIDWAMLLEQPNLNTFAFNPGCIKQFNSISNINEGHMANQEGFAKLGDHFWKSSM